MKKTVSTTADEQPTQPQQPKIKQILLEIVRKDGQTILNFEIAPEITELYRRNSAEIKTSNSWAPLTFYSIPNLIEDDTYRQLLSEFDLFDDYGVSIYSNGRLNIAFIRTVEGKGSIPLRNSLSLAQLSDLTRRTGQFLKRYFEQYFREAKIKSVVSIEL